MRAGVRLASDSCVRTAAALSLCILLAATTAHAADRAPAIFVVRHGQDTDNAQRVLNGRRQTHLTALGRQQARDAADRLRGRSIAAIYYSPLARTRETARILARALGVKQLVPDVRLVERDFGVLTGRPTAEIPLLATKTQRVGDVNYFLRAPGAETFPSTYRRARELLHDLRSAPASRSGDIVLVTHGDTGKMLVANARGWSWRQGLEAANLHNAEVVELSFPTRRPRR
jgi:broad specificity phosphatase PhoE